jgi:NADPH:quinone reductase-like Zn-dependent oxidoreductase
MDFAGVVEAVGAGVTSFEPGDRVFGLSPDVYGAHAEFLCLPETAAIATMPAGVGFDKAEVGEGAWYADTNLQAFHLEPGHSVLIYGASGAIGTAAVQLAKFYGAKVTAVVATQHLDLVRRLGADRVIDYTAQDFTQIDETFDFVFDAVGKTTYFSCRRLLKPKGVFAATDLGPWCQNALLTIWSWITGRHRVIFALPQTGKASSSTSSQPARTRRVCWCAFENDAGLVWIGRASAVRGRDSATKERSTGLARTITCIALATVGSASRTFAICA